MKPRKYSSPIVRRLLAKRDPEQTEKIRKAMTESAENPTNIKPVADRVITRVIPVEKEFYGNIEVFKSKRKYFYGQVVEVGPDVVGLEKGDYVVYFDKTSIKTVEVGEEKYHVNRLEQIVPVKAETEEEIKNVKL